MTLLHGFELVEERQIDELNTHARLLRHAKTGAQLLSLENNDENKVFCVGFFTPPADSSGVAHILEHSVLCGSRKYPLKEPFVELLKGSLQTFLNAFTFPDKTVYPVASQNLRDFYNLIDVYLDAVFYPNLTAYTLQQEGWHYELDALDGPLTYKGVVFNEMKGVYSSPDSLVGRHSQTTLYPDNLYGLDSGGDPTVIPNLTHEAFVAFHHRYYHPSNALITFYGDDEPDERLRVLDGWLSAFEPAPVDHTISAQLGFDAPRRHTFAFDAGAEGAENGKGYVTVNWGLVPNDDAERMLGLTILADALIGTFASPLRKALIDSGLGEDLAGGGLEIEVHPSFFSTGLKGVSVADADKVEALILDTVQRLAVEDFTQETIEASVNSLEFRLREQNTGAFPRGLFQTLSALTTWLHDGDPLAPLAFEAPLNAIKARLARGEHYFAGLLDQYFVHNTHRTTVILTPEAGYAARQAEEEAGRLAQIRAAMSASDLQAVIENTAELKRRQVTPDSPEALAALPALTLADLDKSIRMIPLAGSREQGATLLYHDLFTNGIAYVDVGLNLHALPADLLPYASLFSRALLGMGTQTEDYVTLSQRIGRLTGGIEATTFASTTRRVGEPATAWLVLRGKATTEHGRDLFSIMRDMLLSVRLDDRERFRQIVLEEKAGAEAELIPNGHVVALRRLRASFDEADWATEQMNGIAYLNILRDLAERLDADWSTVQARLEAVQRTLVNREAMLINVTLDAANFAGLRPALVEFLGALPDSAPQMATWAHAADTGNEGLAIPAQVNYVSKGGNLYDLGYTLHGSQLAITNYLGTSYLWERVRVQGGAYGGFSVFDSLSGVFTFLSYRDPNLLQTLDAYDNTGSFLREHDLSQEEVGRSVIGAIGTLDAYQLPDAKGYTSMLRHLIGETDELRQRRRDELLGATVADFRRFGEALEPLRERGRVVVVGSQQAFEAANAARPGLLEIRKLLG